MFLSGFESSNLSPRIMKPIKNAISYVIYNKDRKFLSVKRPDDDIDLPGMWGLPAGNVKDGETFEEAVLRSGRQKLGVELRIAKYINEGELERKDYILHMKLYEAEIVHGEPSVPQQAEGTQYQAWKWAAADDIKETAQKGSLCCRLYLSSINQKW